MKFTIVKASRTKDAPKVTGLEATVTRAAELQEAIDNLETEYKILQGELRRAAIDQLNARRLTGEKLASVALQGDGVEAKVTQIARFQTLEAKGADLGVLADLFEKRIQCKLKADADTSAMLCALLDAGLNPDAYFETKDELVPKNKASFFHDVALRRNEETAADIDHMISEFTYAPQIRFEKK